MRRLCGRGPHFRFVRIDQLDRNRNFFRLTARGARLIGASSSVTDPLGRSTLLRRFALQWFLEVDGQESRWHCNPRDYPDLFAIDGDRLPRANFYLEETEAGTLEKARCIGYLAGIALKAIEAGDLAARLEALESVLKRRNGNGKP